MAISILTPDHHTHKWVFPTPLPQICKDKLQLGLSPNLNSNKDDGDELKCCLHASYSLL